MIYACIGIIDWQIDGAAVETISIAEGVSSLSGAWYVNRENFAEVAGLVSHTLLIEVGRQRPTAFSFDDSTKLVDVQSFLASAKYECESALQAYGAHKSLDPVKRKKLVEPNFTKWPGQLNLENAADELASLGLARSILSTDSEMERVLSVSRLVKWMINGWLHDEQERAVRPYIAMNNSGPRLLPEPWALKLLQGL